MFPLSMVVFPHQVVPLCVFEDRYLQLVEDVKSSAVFGSCLIERGSEVGGGDQRSSVGTLLEIFAVQPLGNGQTFLLVKGQSCFTVEQWLEDDPYPRAIARERCCDDVMIDPDLLNLAQSSVRAVRILQSELEPEAFLDAHCTMAADPWERTWQLCSMAPMAILDQFKILSLSDPNDRLRLLVEICCERYGDFQRLLHVDGPADFA